MEEIERILIKLAKKRYRPGMVVQLEVEPFEIPQDPKYRLCKDEEKFWLKIVNTKSCWGDVYYPGKWAKVLHKKAV